MLVSCRVVLVSVGVWPCWVGLGLSLAMLGGIRLLSGRIGCGYVDVCLGWVGLVWCLGGLGKGRFVSCRFGWG